MTAAGHQQRLTECDMQASNIGETQKRAMPKRGVRPHSRTREGEQEEHVRVHSRGLMPRTQAQHEGLAGVPADELRDRAAPRHASPHTEAAPEEAEPCFM